MATLAQAEYIQPAVTTDIVLFTLWQDELSVLCVRRVMEPFSGWWALPGDYIRANETLNDCAKRTLDEQTGITGVYLEQLYTFTSHYPGRWGRVFNVAHMALVASDTVNPRDETAIAWHPITRLPRLAFNHDEILLSARARLTAKIQYSTIAFQLLPDTFTLAEVQQVYELIKGEQLDKRNFRRFIMALGKLEATGERQCRGAHRPAMLYRMRSPGSVEIIR